MRRAISVSIGVVALGCGSAPPAHATLPVGVLAPRTLDPDAALAEAESLLALEGGGAERDLEIGRALAVAGLPDLAAVRLGIAASDGDPTLALAGLTWWCTVADPTSPPSIHASLGDAALERALSAQPSEIADCVRELVVRAAVEGGTAVSPIAEHASTRTEAGRRTRALALLNALRSAEPDAELALVEAWSAPLEERSLERRVVLALAWAQHPPSLYSQAGPPFREAVLMAHGIPVCDWGSVDSGPIVSALSVLAHRYDESTAGLALSLSLASHVCGAREIPAVQSSLDPVALRIPRLRAAADPTCARGWVHARDEIAARVEEARALVHALEERLERDEAWPLEAITDEAHADAVDRQLVALARGEPLAHGVAAALAPDVERDAPLERVVFALTEPAPTMATLDARLTALASAHERASRAGPLTRAQAEAIEAEVRAVLLGAARSAVRSAAHALLTSGEQELETLTRIAASAEGLPAELARCEEASPTDEHGAR